MTDQPKPNQPPATPNTGEPKQSPKEALPADKAPVTSAKPDDSVTIPSRPPETTRHVDPPKPLGDAKTHRAGD